MASKFLKPIQRVRSLSEFKLAFESPDVQAIYTTENRLLRSNSNLDAFTYKGYCSPCQKETMLIVDMKSGGQRTKNGWIPNWRERLECPDCGMCNRQRLIANLIAEKLDNDITKSAYFMEQVTPIFIWAAEAFPSNELTGSEYLGFDYKGGEMVRGIRHENIEGLSFESNTFDLIVSNDVFEHIPNPNTAFLECFRVLKQGGEMIATIPFYSLEEKSVPRAQLINGELVHILPEQYHGNPVSADGSLVFTDFGWDILSNMKKAGFSDAYVKLYGSISHGHLGGLQIVFVAKK